MAYVVDHFDQYFVWKPTRDFKAGNWTDDMKDVNVEYTCEIGSVNRDDYDDELSKRDLNPIGGRVHGHMTIFTKHTKSVHLNYTKIRDDIQDMMEAEGVVFNGKMYVNGKLLRDMSRAFRYLSKGSPHRDLLETQIAESQ